MVNIVNEATDVMICIQNTKFTSNSYIIGMAGFYYISTLYDLFYFIICL